MPLEVPVTVTFTVPNAAPLVVVKVRMLVLFVLEGSKDAVTPLGRFEADKLTLLEKPFCGVIVIALAPLAAC